MPPTRNLIGQRFGKLVVIRDGGYHQHGKVNRRHWWCVCDCGRETEERHDFLVNGRITACPVCRRGPCVVCGGEIINGGPRVNTCSEECSLEKRRKIDIKCYAKRIANDADFNKKRWENRKKKLIETGTLHDFLARHREYKKRYRSDPDKVYLLRKKSNSYYKKNKDRILFQRKRRFKKLPPEKQNEARVRNRFLQKKWRRKWLEELKKNPEKYSEYQAYQRQKRVEHEQRKALASLLKVGSQLADKIDDDTDNNTE